VAQNLGCLVSHRCFRRRGDQVTNSALDPF